MKWLHRLIRRLMVRLDQSALQSTAPAMSPEDAVAIAAAEASRRQLRWVEPAGTTVRVVDGRQTWIVRSNQYGRGFKVEFMIDDLTREVLDVRTLPR